MKKDKEKADKIEKEKGEDAKGKKKGFWQRIFGGGDKEED